MPEVLALRSRLRELRASYEYADEARWARRIVLHPNPAAELARYPNYEHYIKVADFEMGLLTQTRLDLKRILFIGSGPLPLTAILFAQRFGIEVDCLDLNPEACRLARKVIQGLALSHHLSVQQLDILEFSAFEKYDVVFLAALAGTSDVKKSRIVQHLNHVMLPGQLAVLRSAQGWRALLYTPIVLADLEGFRVLQISDSPSRVIQTEIVVEKCPIDAQHNAEPTR